MPPKGQKKAQPKVEPKVKQDNEANRADYKLRNYAEDNLIDDIRRIQKQIKRTEQSINEHDAELDKKRTNHKKLKQRLQEMMSIQELLNNIAV